MAAGRTAPGPEVPAATGELEVVTVSPPAVVRPGRQELALLPMAVGPDGAFSSSGTAAAAGRPTAPGAFLKGAGRGGRYLTLDFNFA